MAPIQVSRFPQSVVPQAPEDPLFGLMAAYKKDPSENKVDLGIGAYRDDNGKPWVLPAVKRVSLTKTPSWLRLYESRSGTDNGDENKRRMRSSIMILS